MVWNYISCENYGLELYILRELWFGTIYLAKTMVWNNISWNNYGLKNLFLLWRVNCPTPGRNIPGNGSTMYQTVQEMGLHSIMYQTFQEIGLQCTKQSRKWVYKVPNSQRNWAVMYQTVLEIGLQCTKKLPGNGSKLYNVSSPGNGSTMYQTVQETGLQCTQREDLKKVQTVCLTNFQMMMNR